MADGHSKATIVSMAVIASAAATLLHEGLGHGVTAWLRGDIVTDLTSNHLSAMVPDRLVDAAGTIVNLVVGSACLGASILAGSRANTRYFLWLLAALNLLPAAGYFMLSGIAGFGDWYEVIKGLPHQVALRIGMTLVEVYGYRSGGTVAGGYDSAIRDCRGGVQHGGAGLPYYAACLFSCVAGLLDPLGLQLLFMSTIPAAFGGSSGLMWADSLMPKGLTETRLLVCQTACLVGGGCDVGWGLCLVPGARDSFCALSGAHSLRE